MESTPDINELRQELARWYIQEFGKRISQVTKDKVPEMREQLSKEYHERLSALIVPQLPPNSLMIL